MFKNFAFKNKIGYVSSVVSMVDIVAASCIGGQLEITYECRKSVIVDIKDSVNLDEFFNLLSGNQAEAKSEAKSDCCASTDSDVGDSVVGDLDLLVGQLGHISGEKHTSSSLYHVVFNGDVANTIVMNDINTLYVNHQNKSIYVASQRSSLGKKYDFETYGNLFDKFNECYYVIDDLMAIYLYNIVEFKVVRLAEDMYEVSVRYADYPNVCITQTLNIETDRVIHMLNVINKL